MILNLDTNIFNHGLSRHNILAFSQGFPIGLPCRNWIEVGLRLRLRLLLELAVGTFPQGFKIPLSGSFQAVRLALFSSFTSLRTDELLLIETRPSYLSSVQGLKYYVIFIDNYSQGSVGCSRN